MRIPTRVLKQFDSDHSKMSRATIEIIPAGDLRFMGKQIYPFMLHYCDLPDVNYCTYGSVKNPLDDTSEYRPDLRRTWEASDILGWNPVTKTGLTSEATYGGYGLETGELAGWSFGQAIEAWKSGDLATGMRFLGSASHLYQDAASSGGSFFFHGSPVLGGQKSKPAPCIKGYRPRILAKTLPAAQRKVTALYRDIEAASKDSVRQMRQAYRDIASRALLVRTFVKLEAEQQNVACRAVADMLHTATHLAGAKPRYRPAKIDVNLVTNPSFEIDDGENLPEGWHVVRHNLSDRAGTARWLGNYESAEQLAADGTRSVALGATPREGMLWRQNFPRAIPVRAGETYRMSYWIRLCGATGGSYAAVYLCDGGYDVRKTITGPTERGDKPWTRREIIFKIPKGVEFILAGCCSMGNAGLAVFDNVEIVRLGSRGLKAGVVNIPRGDARAILDLRMLEKVFVRAKASHGGWGHHMAAGAMLQDLSPHAKENYGIWCNSRGEWTDLHIRDGGGWCVELSGKDEFIEVPGRGIWLTLGELSTRGNFTVVIDLKCERTKDAVIFARTNNTPAGMGGVELRTTRGEMLSLRLGVDGKGLEEILTAPLPISKWTQLRISLSGGRLAEMWIDDKRQGSAKLTGRHITSTNSLFIGSDNGLSAFLRGKIARFTFYPRAIGPERKVSEK